MNYHIADGKYHKSEHEYDVRACERGMLNYTYFKVTNLWVLTFDIPGFAQNRIILYSRTVV